MRSRGAGSRVESPAPTRAAEERGCGGAGKLAAGSSFLLFFAGIFSFFTMRRWSVGGGYGAYTGGDEIFHTDAMICSFVAVDCSFNYGHTTPHGGVLFVALESGIAATPLPTLCTLD